MGWRMVRNDPWREMAIEEQFKDAVKEPQWDTPSTLLYLEENSNLVMPSCRYVVEAERLNLHAALTKGIYAYRLIETVWGEDVWDEDEFLERVMEERLPNYEELLEVVVQNRRGGV